MIPELGHFLLWLALGTALVLATLPMIGAARGNAAWMALARPAALLQFVFVVGAFACLVAAFVNHDFSVDYVANNSNSALPLYYRLSGVWGGHEGSMLLWQVMLVSWTLAVALFSRHLPQPVAARILAGMGWLEKNARPDDGVFSSLDIGQYIPMMSGTHAYLAHWAQTLDFFTKTSNVDQFLAGRLDTAQQNRVLADGSVDYVFWGPVERASGYVPDLPTLKPVYTNPQVTIYQVESQP